jgi:catechol 2,3-dioxygenase-like lactoylglutathione lyase family enzyme
VTLLVEDYDSAIEYFVQRLGFELVEDSRALAHDGHPKRWVIRPPHAVTGLLLAQADGDEQTAATGSQVGDRVGFFLEVDDFDRTYERMVASGVEFVSPPCSEPYGNAVVFRDIAGNRWDLISRE